MACFLDIHSPFNIQSSGKTFDTLLCVSLINLICLPSQDQFEEKEVNKQKELDNARSNKTKLETEQKMKQAKDSHTF